MLASQHSRVKSCAALLALAALMWLPPAAEAQDGTTGTRPLLPNEGMYYDPEQGGTGLGVDIDANGYVFATLYAYDPAGNPTFYAMQGYFQPAADAAEAGFLGTLDAPLYSAHGGECLGDGCAYQQPTAAATGLQAHIVWTNSRRATLTIGAQTWALQAAHATTSVEDMLSGTWTATFTGIAIPPPYFSPPHAPATSDVSILKVRPMQPQPYPDDAYTAWEVECAKGPAQAEGDLASRCPELYGALVRESGSPPVAFDGCWIRYDHRDGTIHLGPYTRFAGVPALPDPGVGKSYQLQLSPGVLRGRETGAAQAGDPESASRIIDAILIDMIRVHDDTFEISHQAG